MVQEVGNKKIEDVWKSVSICGLVSRILKDNNFRLLFKTWLFKEQSLVFIYLKSHEGSFELKLLSTRKVLPRETK